MYRSTIKYLRYQIDCGDARVTPFDPVTAIKQDSAAYRSALRHPLVNEHRMKELNMRKGLDGKYHPRIIAMGGDHTIVSISKSLLLTCEVLFILNAVHEMYGPVSVIHFDAHIDTWNPDHDSGSRVHPIQDLSRRVLLVSIRTRIHRTKLVDPCCYTYQILDMSYSTRYQLTWKDLMILTMM